jgi:hypothetical protein
VEDEVMGFGQSDAACQPKEQVGQTTDLNLLNLQFPDTVKAKLKPCTAVSKSGEGVTGDVVRTPTEGQGGTSDVAKTPDLTVSFDTTNNKTATISCGADRSVQPVVVMKDNKIIVSCATPTSDTKSAQLPPAPEVMRANFTRMVPYNYPVYNGAFMQLPPHENTFVQGLKDFGKSFTIPIQPKNLGFELELGAGAYFGGKAVSREVNGWITSALSNAASNYPNMPPSDGGQQSVKRHK